MIRLGIISYLNTLPVYYAIEKGLVKLPPEVEVVKDIPSALNHKLQTGEVDVAVVSAFEYAKHYKDYLILPQLCIGANGEVKSVLFFSRVPMEKLNGKRVLLTKASLTSKNLLLFLFKQMGVSPIYEEISPGTSPSRNHEGILLIGDDALKMLSSNRYPYVYDLALLWKERYHTPFVFALWCVREEAYRKSPQLVKECWRILVTSKKLSHKMYRRIAMEKAKDLNLTFHECMEYLNVLHFDLEKDFLKGLKLFFHKMYQGGLLHEKPLIRFAY